MKIFSQLMSAFTIFLLSFIAFYLFFSVVFMDF